MKNITIWMDTQVQNYEKSFGEIDMTPPKITSPIQKSDLENSKDKK